MNAMTESGRRTTTTRSKESLSRALPVSGIYIFRLLVRVMVGRDPLRFITTVILYSLIATPPRQKARKRGIKSRSFTLRKSDALIYRRP